MAELSDFLGSLVASMSHARVLSDIQSVKIAEEYAKNNFLQHFAVPRMRIKDVELTIPVAIEKLSEKPQKKYEPIDNKNFASITYQKILESLGKKSLPVEVSKTLRTDIAKSIQSLESLIKLNQKENALADFSKKISLKVLEQKNQIFINDPGLLDDTEFFSNLQNKIIERLQNSLKDEIKLTPESKDSVQVTVEAAKLREIKPENIIIIKMKISEEGMEWIKMENNDGEVVSKLVPE